MSDLEQVNLSSVKSIFSLIKQEAGLGGLIEPWVKGTIKPGKVAMDSIDEPEVTESPVDHFGGVLCTHTV